MQRAKETGVVRRAEDEQHPGRRSRPRGRARPVSPQKRLNLLLALFGGGAAGLRAGVLLRVPRQPDQDARRDPGAPRAAVPRHGAGHRREGVGPAPAPQQRRARRTSPRRSARSGPTCCSRPRRRARGRSWSRAPARARARAWWRATWPISLAQAGQRVLLIDADMRKPQGARDLRRRAGAGPLEPAGRQREGERSGPQDERRRPVGAAGRPHAAEPGGAARLAAVPRLPRRR